VTVGATEANLLVPMYAVVAAAALQLAWELRRRARKTRSVELGPVAWPLAGFVAWSGLSLLWTDDLRQGSIDLLFFYLPFGLLALALARLPWRRRWLLILLGQLAAMAVVFAAIGIYQYETRNIFWNPKVEIGNAYAPFYRVNSVFWDPSIYGRFLVVAILACLVVVLFARDRRLLAGGAAVIAFTWVGLYFSYSQSSFAALIAGTFAAAAVVWRWRAAAALALASLVVVSAGFATPQVRHTLLERSKTGLNAATSGRAGLVSNGLRIAADHPVAGVGTGGFKRAYAERTGLKGREPKKAASHSTPVTVAAETGFPGLALLAWLGGASLLAAFRGRGRSDAGRTAFVVGLTLGAIAVHSLFYNALFEDPTTWALLGLVARVAAERRPEAPT
jgi:O-antigen ligase